MSAKLCSKQVNISFSSMVIPNLSDVSTTFMWLTWTTLPFFFPTLCSFTVARWKWIFFIALWSSSRYKHILSLLRSFLVIVGHMQPFGSLLFFAAFKFIMHVRSFRKYFWNTEKGIFSGEVLNSALQDQQK